jgi:hypothetical protein
MNATNQESLPTATVVKLVLSWALVGGPLCWGVYHTLQNAMKLFY